MNPCIVIPVYNHGEALVGTLDSLSGYALPTIVVDDGSDEKTKAIVAVHLTGNPCGLRALESVAGRHGLGLIEVNLAFW